MKPQDKSKLIIEMQARYGYNVFVETGTNWGYTLERVNSHFKRNFSIEIQSRYYEMAKKKFKGKNINLLLGDSTIVLPDIAKELKEPAIFWIDAHYSEKDNIKPPVEAELSAIMESPYPHVVLIDDARLFIRILNKHLTEFPIIDTIIDKLSPRFDCEVNDDVIICLPKK